MRFSSFAATAAAAVACATTMQVPTASAITNTMETNDQCVISFTPAEYAEVDAQIAALNLPAETIADFKYAGGPRIHMEFLNFMGTRAEAEQAADALPREFMFVQEDIASLEADVEELQNTQPSPDYPAELIQSDIDYARYFITIYKYLLTKEEAANAAYAACAAGRAYDSTPIIDVPDTSSKDPNFDIAVAGIIVGVLGLIVAAVPYAKPILERMGITLPSF